MVFLLVTHLPLISLCLVLFSFSHLWMGGRILFPKIRQMLVSSPRDENPTAKTQDVTFGHDDPCQRSVAGVHGRQAHCHLTELLRDHLGHRVGKFLQDTSTRLL